MGAFAPPLPPPTGPRGPLFSQPTTDFKQSESIIFFNSYSLIV